MILFFLGCTLGAIFGVVIAALLFAGRNLD